MTEKPKQVDKFKIKLESKHPKWTLRHHPDKLIVVEKNIPIPLKSAYGEQIPFRELEIGDSLFIDFICKERVRQRAKKWLKQNNLGWEFRFEVTAIGVRIWRSE
jgi:hypothetical protein